MQAMEKVLTRKASSYKTLADDVEMSSLIEKQRSNTPDEWLNSAGHTSNLRHAKQGSQLLEGTHSHDVIYEDNFITIYPDQIKIYNYYFPLGKPKFIKFTNIVSLSTPESMKLPWWDHMNWGRGYNSIWWARDEDRGFDKKHKAIIIKESGETTLKAFSVVNRDQVMDILKERIMLC